jgi:hypothetical protein
MSKLSPYRSLSPERRFALVMYVMRSSREGREQFIQRLVARGGGFRAVTLRKWPVERVAKEVVRTKSESVDDEHDLLQLLYVDLEPEIQSTFLDAAGVQHDNGKIAEALQPPYADAEAVRRGAAAVQEKHGVDGARYLRTIAKYSRDGWPGIEEIVDDPSMTA